MKNIFKYFIPCMTLIFAMTSCYDTMDDKRSIDGTYESQFANPSIVIAAAESPVFNTINVTLSLPDPSLALEIGVQVSSTNNFDGADFVAAETVSNNSEISLSGFEELTTYYIRAYAVPKNGSAVVYSEAKAVTTISAPLVDLAGTYTATDYRNGNSGFGIFSDNYKVTIAFEEGSDDVVNITGLALPSCDYFSDATAETVQGIYDAEAQTITIPNNSVVATTADYGQVWIVAYEASALVLKFNPKGGSIKSEITRYACAAGSLGYFYHELQHD